MRLRVFALFGLAILVALTAFPGQAQAATFTVTKTADTNDGTCDADCSLREAIIAANTSTGADTISLPAGTYTLVLGIEFNVTQDLTLSGAEDTIIQAAAQPGQASSRIMKIASGDVTIIGVTLRYGNLETDKDDLGGGILSAGNLTLTDSVVAHNTADFGGGIFSEPGTVILVNSTVNGNIGETAGGGLYIAGTLHMTNSTISNNASRNGGGLWNRGDSTVHLTSSTINGNSADEGGGIQNRGTLTMTNSTVTDNLASGSGGGIHNLKKGTSDPVPLTLVNSTVTENTAVDGGGVYNSGGTVQLVNTIVAKNTASTGPDCSGDLASLGHNLIGFDFGCNFAAKGGDLVGMLGDFIDPLLGPLQDNGGPTETHALLEGSPAIDAGDNISCPETDQRDIARPQGSVCDIGAFELNLPPVAENDSYSVHQGSTLDTISDGLPGVLDNDNDPEGDDLMAIPVGTVSHGELALNPSGEFTYIPEPGFSGEVSFIYFAYDGLLASNEATVTITVVPLCTLDIELSYADGNLTMDFELGILEQALWKVWLVAVGHVILLWPIPIPVVDQPIPIDVPVPFPALGEVGILTALFTSEGITCSDWATVDTGAPLSSTPAPEELRELFRGVNTNQVLSGN